MTAIVEQAAQKYARLEVETGVAAASPQRLIVMLYDGAVRSLLGAKAALAAGDIGARGAKISKAISIIDEGLRPAVDPAAGGEIAQNLLGLYEYIVNRLLLANLKSDEASLDEAIALLTELKGAWEMLERQSVREQAAVPQPEARVPGLAASYGRV
jgi:flagellar secretion chaperone FliS